MSNLNWRPVRGEGLKPAEARAIVISYFELNSRAPVLVGPLSVLLGVRYGLNETERLLDEMVADGILARAPEGGYIRGSTLTK